MFRQKGTPKRQFSRFLKQSMWSEILFAMDMEGKENTTFVRMTSKREISVVQKYETTLIQNEPK